MTPKQERRLVTWLVFIFFLFVTLGADPFFSWLECAVGNHPWCETEGGK
jgi:hypothetical protein